MSELEEKYMPTKEVKSTLRISDCDVMHLREAGEIAFTRKGNGFWYLRFDVEKLKDENHH